MNDFTSMIAPPEEDTRPWDACIARSLREADRQWEARRARQEIIRSRYQTEHPASRLIRSSAMKPAWATL